jgi:predicted dehydrogenase
MSNQSMSRRDVLKGAFAVGGAAILTGRSDRAEGFLAANERPRVAAIGTGSRWCQKAAGLKGPHGTAPEFKNFGDYIAVCDADANRRGLAAELVKGWCGKSPDVSTDYRAILDRKDVDIVHITTPDHWHAKIAIEALKAGKDVYCEKPMTLTIEEGQRICETVKKTGRIVQIGTQQRSDMLFLRAIALIRDGRIGKVTKATCGIGGATSSPKLPVADVPKTLDWNLWLGPVPFAEYRYLAGDNGETKSWSRCHYEFRWWYEYSGGKLTDWGAHHVDIATWAMRKTATGPISVNPLMVKHPVEFKDGYPIDNSRYNTATEFLIQAEYADGMKLDIRHDGPNGIKFEGTEGSLFVSRGQLKGKPVDDLKTKPLPDGAIEKVYKDRPVVDHIKNFFECVVARREPISDVFSHHRALTTCHLAGIAARFGRPIKWDPTHETIIDDKQAQGFLARERRKGFEIEV